jgi:hypothetical protein
MKAKRKVAGKNWEFDGSTITVRIPMAWKRHGGRKVIIAPDGGDAWAPAKPRPDKTLIRALARAHRWKRLLEEGRYRCAAEIADAEGVTRSFANRMMRLTLLAPDIAEAILEGRQPRGLVLEELTRAMPSAWEEQHRLDVRAIREIKTPTIHRSSQIWDAYGKFPQHLAVSAHDQLDRGVAQQDDGRMRVARKGVSILPPKNGHPCRAISPRRRRSTRSMLGASVFLSLSR